MSAAPENVATLVTLGCSCMRASTGITFSFLAPDLQAARLKLWTRSECERLRQANAKRGQDSQCFLVTAANSRADQSIAHIKLTRVTASLAPTGPPTLTSVG